MMRAALLLLLALVLPALSGCAAMDAVERSPVAAKFTVQQATLRVIREDAERAYRALELTDQVRDQVSGAVTVDALDAYLRAQIDWPKLSLADAQLLAMLLDEIHARLVDRIGLGQLRPEDQLAVHTVLDWIKDAANLVVRMRG